MIDNSRLKEALVKYKEDFVSTQWKQEKYKWEAVKTFRDNWDVNEMDSYVTLSSRPLAGNGMWIKMSLLSNETIRAVCNRQL